MILNIGLIDKNVIIRLGIGMIVSEHFEACFSEADDASEFALLHGGKALDAIILASHDYSQNYIDTITRVRERFRHVPLIVFDDREAKTFRSVYLELGVHGYLLKRTLSEELPSCLREVIAGRRFLSSDLFQTLMVSFQKPSMITDSWSRLTRREAQIASLLCKGMRTNLIADSLGRKPSTISTIKHNIMKKMNVRSVMELSQVFERNHQ